MRYSPIDFFRTSLLERFSCLNQRAARSDYVIDENNIFILNLESHGNYLWHSFYGKGDNNDDTVQSSARGIAVNATGDIFVTGESNYSWHGPSGQNPLHAYPGTSSAVVLKVGSAGMYQWHAFYGTGSSGWGITLDHNNDAYITGYSNATWGNPFHPYIGGYNLFVLKLSGGGSYQWNTFYGADNSWWVSLGYGDYGSAIAIDNSGNIYSTGYSSQTWNGGGLER